LIRVVEAVLVKGSGMWYMEDITQIPKKLVIDKDIDRPILTDRRKKKGVKSFVDKFN